MSLRIIEPADLEKILAAHKEWIESARAKGERANLSGADLRSADLRSANLSGANLRSADLRSADLRSADLSDLRSDEKTQWPAFFIVPELGAFVAWKKLRNGVIAKLQIPAAAKRTSSLIGRKCRAEYVKTLAMVDAEGKPFKGKGVSSHSEKCTYEVGKITRADKYDPSIFIECSGGIHLFITRAEAEAY